MPPAFEQIKQLIAPSEGNVSFMYLDTKGLVTVGIGNLLSSVAAATALPFVSRATQDKATIAEIAADFAAVSRQEKARVANHYRQFTSTDLPEAAVDQLFQKRIDQFFAQLRASYPKFDSYPDPAQLAMLDMAFNLGTSGLKNKWPKLNAAIDAEDWTSASVECLRPDGNAARNASTKALFVAAAQGTPA